MCYALGDFDDARNSWQSALDTASHANDTAGKAYAHAGLGLVAMSARNVEYAAQQLNEGIRLADRVADQWLVSLANIWLGTLLLVGGDPAAATPLFQRGLDSGRARGDRLVTYVALFNLAQAAMAQDDYAGAETFLHESILLSRETQDAAQLAFALDGLAVIEGHRGSWRRAAVMLGAAQAMREATGGRVYNYYLPDESRRACTDADARVTLGPGYDEAIAEGARLDIAAATAYASARTP